MLIDSDTLWVAQTNTYVVAPEPGGLAIVVDAPPDPGAIAALLARHDLTPVALLLTHGHIDHVGGSGAFVRETGVAAYVHPDDDYLTLNPEAQLRQIFGMATPGDYAPAVRHEPLHGGQSLTLAGMDFEVRHTPGHTPGHCCFLMADEGVLFSGDQLFAGSIGRSDLPGGSFDDLMASMAREILPLDDEIIVHSGHGPTTTVGRERRTNPFLQDLA
jgi:hydroxyacylglutathione hydrolase